MEYRVFYNCGEMIEFFSLWNLRTQGTEKSNNGNER